MLALLLGAHLLLAQTVPAFPDPAPPPTVPALIRDAALRHGVDAQDLLRVLACESGLNPHAVGDHGTSLGLAQLNTRGLLPTFYQLGYTDPFDPAQAADFTAWAFRQGLRRHWTCAR